MKWLLNLLLGDEARWNCVQRICVNKGVFLKYAFVILFNPSRAMFNEKKNFSNTQYFIKYLALFCLDSVRHSIQHLLFSVRTPLIISHNKTSVVSSTLVLSSSCLCHPLVLHFEPGKPVFYTFLPTMLAKGLFSVKRAQSGNHTRMVKQLPLTCLWHLGDKGHPCGRVRLILGTVRVKHCCSMIAVCVEELEGLFLG